MENMCPSVSKPLSQLSALTFLAKSWQNDACSQNGLPMTPNAISILGRFQFLKTIEHRNLCLYLDILRGKHGKLNIIVINI
jgi:TBC domain-containing protein kinase-like protein